MSGPLSGVSRWGRRNRVGVVISVVVLAALGALTAVASGSSVHGGDLDPDNPSPDGARAVARVLDRHGVQVEVVRRAAGLASASIDADSTVLVTGSERLGDSTARQVRALSADAGAIVLPAPALTLSRALGLPRPDRSAPAGDLVQARCDDPLLAGLAVAVRPTDGYSMTGRPSVHGCFPVGRRRPVSLVTRVDGSSTTYLVAADDVFRNGRITDGDNAAVALRLLGQHDHLVWYVPDLRDVPAGDGGSFAAQLPRGLVPGLWLLGAAALATMLWRGRRLGPLVVEPLPVTVKAVESTQGRGRLYRHVRDRDHAAAILRRASAARLLARLRLPGSTGPEQLVRSVAGTTGRDPRAVHDLLVGRAVPRDRDLTRLGNDLAELEKEVHDR
jgi:Domain of unknown function (DUF4350)